MAKKEDVKNDPWELSQGDAEQMKNMTKGSGSAGVFCPKRNVSIGGPCNVCNTLQPMWDFPEGTKERKLASKKKATVSYFLNVILSGDRTKSIVLEIGKKAGDYIIDAIYDPDKNWKMIAHPVANKGFYTKIKKRKGDMGFNTYDTFRGDPCDWEVSKEVLGNMTQLSQENLIRMISAGELVEGENFMRISSLKMDETITFRVLPPWNYKDGGKAILTPVFRHYGVSQAEVDGTVPMNTSLDDGEETHQPAEHGKKVDNDPPWTVDESKKTTEQVSGTKQPCFGAIEPMVFYDSEDEDCKKCVDKVECIKMVDYKKKKAAKASLAVA